MLNATDVRRLALAPPEVTEAAEAELAALLRDAWTIQAPKRLRNVYDEGRDRRE